MTDLQEPQWDGPITCNLCGEEVVGPYDLEVHMWDVHEQADDDLKWWHWVLAIPVLLWEAKGGLIGLVIVAGIVLAAFGVFDKEKVADSRSCPGYQLVRDLKAKGQINTFAAVKPEDGWNCEYSLDNEDAEVRFRGHGEEVEIEVAGRSTPAYFAALREAKAEGFLHR